MSVYLEHANVTVPSIDEAIRFLTAAFPEFSVRGGGKSQKMGRKWVHVGSEKTYLALNEQSGQRLDSECGGHGLNHLGFVTDELDSIDERLSAAGYQEDVSFREEGPYRRRHYYFDDNGMEWEFIEYSTADASLRNQY